MHTTRSTVGDLPTNADGHARAPLTHLPTTMGLVQPGTSLGMLEMTMGSLNTVPLRMFRMVPLGLFHLYRPAGRN